MKLKKVAQEIEAKGRCLRAFAKFLEIMELEQTPLSIHMDGLTAILEEFEEKTGYEKGHFTGDYPETFEFEDVALGAIAKWLVKSADNELIPKTLRALQCSRDAEMLGFWVGRLLKTLAKKGDAAAFSETSKAIETFYEGQHSTEP